jgi:hypothetical protein
VTGNRPICDPDHVSTRTLTRRGPTGRRADAPAAPAGRGTNWHYDRTGERVDQDELAELEEASAGPVRCRYGAIIAVDGVCCGRWPHPL